MSDTTRLDELRGEALLRIERTEKSYKRAFLAAAAMESIFIVGFLLLADLANRLHLLLLVSAVGVYSIVILGLVVLGVHVSRCTERVLRGISLLDH